MDRKLIVWTVGALLAGCSGDKDDTASAGESGETAESGDTADSGDSGENGESGDSGESGETGVAAEVCNGVDDDGDGLVDTDDPDLVDGITAYSDADGDGYGISGTGTLVCEVAAGQAPADGDCDDTRADVSPAGEESCDNVDEDCSGVVDDNLVDAPEWYPDTDGDGYGDTWGTTVLSCTRPDGYVGNATDCLDTAAECHPGGIGVCEAAADCNCDGSLDHQCSLGDLELVDRGAVEGYTGADYTTHVDVTGDGVADLVASTPYADEGGAWLGYIEVYEGPITARMSPSSGRITGTRDRGLLGFSLDASDFDGDGVGDLLYMGPQAPDGAMWTGGAYVTYGPITAPSTSDDADWVVTTDDATESVGYAVQAAGDLDADGDQDVAVSYSGYSSGGSVWIFTPTAGEALDISAGQVGVYSTTSRANAGSSIGAGRDLDGDGQVDLVIGAPAGGTGDGEVAVYWGPVTGLTAWDDADVTVSGTGRDTDIGAEATVLDDFDADGLPELFIPRYEGACVMGASVAGAYLTTDAPLHILGPGHIGITAFDYSTGSAVVTDINADGTLDLVVGNDGTSVDFEGVLAVLLGPVPSGVTLDDANLWWYGGLYEGLGAENRLVGDTDGDGFPELLTYSADYSGYGSLYLLDGAMIR